MNYRRETMNTRMMIRGLGALLAAGIAAAVVAEEAAAPAPKKCDAAPTCAMKCKDLKPQTVCPITGKAISKDAFCDVGGVRIYLCGPGCADKVKADPKAAITKMLARGERPECPCARGGKCADCPCAPECCAAGAKAGESCPMAKPEADAAKGCPMAKPAGCCGAP